MPPKSKAAKSTKPANPLAHLSQTQRKKLATAQVCKLAPQTTRRRARGSSPLPDVAELVSTTSKQQVHFANEDGAGSVMETDRSEGEGESGGDDDESESEAGEEAGNEDGMVDKGPSEHIHQPKGKCRGRVTGSTGYTSDGEQVLVKGVAKYYNDRVKADRERTWDSLKAKYNRILKWPKPTGDATGSTILDAALEVEAQRLAKEETIAIDDDQWSDSDDPVGSASANEAPIVPKPQPKKSYAKAEPGAAPPVPTPPPFAQSKPTKPRSASQTLEPKLLGISSSDSDVVILSDTATPANLKRKAKSGANKSGVTYYAGKASEATEDQAKKPKRHNNSQAMIQSIHGMLTSESGNDTGHGDAMAIAKVELFGRDRTIERLQMDLAAMTKQCHQMERQADSLLLVMTTYGIPVPEEASKARGGPALSIALATFLRSHLPMVVPIPAAVPATIPAAVPAAIPATVPAAIPAAVPTAVPTIARIIDPIATPATAYSDAPGAPSLITPATPTMNTHLLDGHGDSNDSVEFPIDTTIDKDMEDASALPAVPSGSNLSMAEKGKIAAYPGN
ncbi:hypothetical protein FRC11_001472 [Ceratobasidium sp. 423]|nr:hypothetical protein FRC11_001472 [Ceratobasidium sp. 423]